MPARAARLPAPIVVTTDCGRFRIDERGRVSFHHGFALPVPAGTSYYMDLTWYRLRGGHLIIGHRKRTLWHSRARFRGRYVDIGAVASSRAAVAFSIFHGRRQSLFVARQGQAERLVATGETPLGFTSRGVLISLRRWTLLLRGGPDWRPRRLIRGATNVVFDHAAQAVYFVAGGRLGRQRAYLSAPRGNEGGARGVPGANELRRLRARSRARLARSLAALLGQRRPGRSDRHRPPGRVGRSERNGGAIARHGRRR